MLSEADIGIDDLGLRRPSMDDVFLSLTGHAVEADEEDGAGPG
jgi:ABC-2 type transport system ATP-binding protein